MKKKKSYSIVKCLILTICIFLVSLLLILTYSKKLNYGLDFTKEEVEAAIDALGKGASVRGETLTLEEFARLSDLLSPYKKG